MFETVTYARLEALERKLDNEARWVNRAHFRQMSTLRYLETADAHRGEGHRSMVEWVAARLDVTRQVASQLLYIARHISWHQDLESRFRAGDVTLDRVDATLQLVEASRDADRPELVAAADDHDIAGIRRMTAACRRITRYDEQKTHLRRYWAMQPTLDGTAERIAGLLPAAEASVVHRALVQKAETFPTNQVTPTTSGQRLADALVAVAHDTLDHSTATHSSNEVNTATRRDTVRRVPALTIFVDAEHATPTRGETGATIAAGGPVGPTTLERILCEGTIGVVYTEDAIPVSTSARSRTISPAIRDLVLKRDGACTIEGCTSRYRLQPHHLKPYARGGTHHPDNLTTLCWYHHHIEVHRYRRHLDPQSPPQRRRFLRRNREPRRTADFAHVARGHPLLQ